MIVFIVSVDVGETSPLRVVPFPWQVVLGDIRKISKQEPVRHPASQEHPPGFQLYFLGSAWVPWWEVMPHGITKRFAFKFQS